MKHVGFGNNNWDRRLWELSALKNEVKWMMVSRYFVAALLTSLFV